LISQTLWTDSELIIVANDPNPVEQKILKNFEQKWPEQVKVIVVPREALYASWNRCIQASNADLLAIANVDDIRTPQGLEQQVARLEKWPEASFCYGPFNIVNQFRAVEGRKILPPAFDPVEFTRSMHLGPFFVWRKAVHEKIGYFDEQFRSGGDFDFAIRLAMHGRGVLVDELLGYYLDTGSGLSTGSDLQPIERTVIELRYGIFDKIDYDFLLEALKYNVSSCYLNGEWHSVSRLVPNYDKFILNRKKIWFEAGIEAYAKKLCKRKKRQRAIDIFKQYFGFVIRAYRGARRLI